MDCQTHILQTLGLFYWIQPSELCRDLKARDQAEVLKALLRLIADGDVCIRNDGQVALVRNNQPSAVVEDPPGSIADVHAMCDYLTQPTIRPGYHRAPGNSPEFPNPQPPIHSPQSLKFKLESCVEGELYQVPGGWKITIRTPNTREDVDAEFKTVEEALQAMAQRILSQG